MGAIRMYVGPRQRLALKIGAAVLAVGLAVAIGTAGTPSSNAATGKPTSTGTSARPSGGGGGGGNAGSSPADAQQVQGCDDLPGQIDRREAVKAELLVKCDEREFGLSEGARQAALAEGKTVEVRETSICAPVNDRAASGDSTLDFGLAFHCRQQQEFANEVNGANGLAEPQLSAQCTGAEVRQQRGEKVDKFTQQMCAGEQAALDGALGVGGGGRGGR